MNILLICLLSLSAFAIPEKDYESVWKTQVLAALDSHPAKEFINKQGKKVAYRTYIRGAGLPNIVISPGRQEPMKKYYELVHDIQDANFYLIDHQGQGESERLLKDPQKGHVISFQDYVNDFSFWMNTHVLAETKGERLYLVAHSMGGAIATRYMEKNPGIFKKVVLSAPMYDVYTKPYPGKVARILAKALMLAGQGNKYAPDRGPYIPEDDTLEKNEFSHSLARIEMNKYLFVEENLALGGTTVRWVNEAFKGMSGIQFVGKKLSQPILLLQAELDTTVMPAKQTQFCQLAANCKLVQMKGSFHEILQEKDSIRNHAIELIRSHLGF